MNGHFLTLLAVIVVIATCGCERSMPSNTTQAPAVAPITSDSDHENHAGPVYTVAAYDPDANPTETLAATVSRATEGGKRIILEIGGQW